MMRQTIHVMLLDDNLTHAARVRSVLKPRNGTDFQLEHFTTLKTGLDGLKSARCDVLLLDLGLPDSNGFRTLSKVIAAAPRLPILVLAGADVPSGVLESLKNDGRNYMSKSRMIAEDLVAAVLQEVSGIKGSDGNGEGHRAVRVLVVEDDNGDLATIKCLLA